MKHFKIFLSIVLAFSLSLKAENQSSEDLLNSSSVVDSELLNQQTKRKSKKCKPKNCNTCKLQNNSTQCCSPNTVQKLRESRFAESATIKNESEAEKQVLLTGVRLLHV